MRTVLIGAAPTRPRAIAAIAAGAAVELAPEAIARIQAAREVVEQVVASGEAVYGLTTGVGHLKDVRVRDDHLRELQRALLMTHAGGLEPIASRALVRSAMAVRIAGMAQGGSGATVRVVQALVDLLNAGVHPVVAEEGSVGAGDIGQMAAIGQVVIGMGRAELAGHVLPGAEALARAGLEPVDLQPKDGLALISANGLSIGRAVLALRVAHDLAELADVVAALSLEAVAGNPSACLPAVGTAKPYPGQVAALQRMRKALAGGYLVSGTRPRSVQDPLAFRVAPQVNGAFREAIDWTERAVTIELNSRSDNPMVDVETSTIVHNGNFHPMVMALALDQLRVAIAHAGALGERRINHLWDECFARANATQLDPEAFQRRSGLPLRFPAAAVTADLRQLAAPATLDVPPLEFGLEDHATGAALAARKTDEALSRLTDILTVELLMANDVLSVTADPPRLGSGTGAALAALRDVLATVPEAAPHEVHRLLRDRGLPAVLRASR